jgi:polyisoprenoid-binding protein YceI
MAKGVDAGHADSAVATLERKMPNALHCSSSFRSTGEFQFMSRALIASAIALLLTLTAAAQDTWQLDPPHSSAQFSVRHLGVSTVRGAFTKVSGSVQYDSANPGKSSIQATIDAASVDTRVDMRDNDLRSPNFLDVKKFPTIAFQSKRIEAAGAGKLKMTGGLTIHGVTKEVVLDVDGPTAPMKDPWGNQRMGASASTKINRLDFGVGGPPGVVGDEINLTLDIEMIKQMPK